MFKTIFLSLVLSLSVPAWAVTEHPDGSLTLSKQEVAQLNAEVQSLLQQAYTAGAEKALDVLKNNPKLCPKNI